MFITMELKYDQGIVLIGKKNWILEQKQKYSKTEDVFCYWSPDLNECRDQMRYAYSEKHTGEPALFKVFILKLTDSLEEAQRILKGRVTSVAKRFRDPGNTDEELKKMEAKRKRLEKKDMKEKQAEAHAINIKYLVDSIEFAAPSTSATSKRIDTTKNFVNDPPSTSASAGNTDEDIKKAEATRKILEEKDSKEEEAEAHAINIKYLVNSIELAAPSNLATSKRIDTVENFISEMKLDPLLDPCLKKSNGVDYDEDQSFLGEVEFLDSDEPYNDKLLNEKIDFESNGNLEVQEQHSEIQFTNSISEVPMVQPTVHDDVSYNHELTYDEWLKKLLKDEFNLDENPEIIITQVTEKDLVKEDSCTAVSDILKISLPANQGEAEIVILDFDKLSKANNDLTIEVNAVNAENNALKIENEQLKAELVLESKRNVAFQNHFVAIDERVPETLFVEKVGGRLYRGNIFVSKKQCDVLEKCKTDREYMNSLLMIIFKRNGLVNHSVTGKPSNKTKEKKGRTKLDPTLLKLVYDIMDARAVANKTKKLSNEQKNAITAKKISNTNPKNEEQ